MMPFWLGCFVAAGVIAVLSVIPFVMFFGMILSAGLLGPLVTLGFAALVYEAYKTSRWVLIAPALYFGGYYALVAQERLAMSKVSRELNDFNAGKSVAFRAGEHDIVLDGDVGVSPSGLIQNYPVDIAYQAVRPGSIKTNRGQTAFRATRLALRGQCDAIKNNRTYRDAGIYPSWITSKNGFSPFCEIDAPESPTRPAVTIKSVETAWQHKMATPTINRRTLVVSAPGGSDIELATGSLAPLSWIPSLYFLCWEKCEGGWWRTNSQELGGTPLDVVARTLGLPQSPLASRAEPARQTLPGSYDQIALDRTRLSLTNLDRIIADPTVMLTVHDIAGLTERVDLWREKVPDMLATLGTALDMRRARERAQLLQGLLVKVPDAEWPQVGGSMLALFAARPNLNGDFQSEAVMERLGDLGVGAAAVLQERLQAARRYTMAGPLLGLCRIGLATADRAESIISKLDDVGYERDDLTAAVVALHRLGRGDLLARIVTPQLHAKDRYLAGVVDKIATSVTTASGPEVCRRYEYWSR